MRTTSPDDGAEHAVPFKPTREQVSAMQGILDHQVEKVRILRADVQRLEALAAEPGAPRKAKRAAAAAHLVLDHEAEFLGALRKRLKSADALPPSRYRNPETRNDR